MGAHYLAFFRRMLIKWDYLPLDPSKIDKDLQEMEREITRYTEWTMFDDVYHKSIGSW